MSKRTIHKMLNITQDQEVLRRIVQESCGPDFRQSLENNLKKHGMVSRREVHFARGYAYALETENDPL